MPPWDPCAAAAASDLFTLPLSCVVARTRVGTSVSCEERRDFHSGNYLLLDRPPASRDDVVAARDAWGDVFAGVAGLEVEMYEWYSGSAEAVDFPVGFVMSAARVLIRTGPAPLITQPAGYRVHSIAGDSAWAALASVIAAHDPALSTFWEWRLAKYRELVERGRGAWFVASRDGGLAACGGVFWDSGLLRFQHVWTKPGHRGRGIAGALCAHALAACTAAPVALIVAEAGGVAERVYRRLGSMDFCWLHTAKRSLTNRRG